MVYAPNKVNQNPFMPWSNDDGMVVLTDPSTLKPLEDSPLVTDAPDTPKSKNFLQQFAEWFQNGGQDKMQTVGYNGSNLYTELTGKKLPFTILPPKTNTPTNNTNANTSSPIQNNTEKKPFTLSAIPGYVWVIAVVVIVGIVVLIFRKKNA